MKRQSDGLKCHFHQLWDKSQKLTNINGNKKNMKLKIYSLGKDNHYYQILNIVFTKLLIMCDE